MSTDLFTGFRQTTNGLEISKDPQAQLIYTFDWSDWLVEGDSITNVDYSINVRSNDPTPLLKITEGFNDNVFTFVELSEGQLNKTYTVTAKITTSNGLVDRRSFRAAIVNRSA